MMFFTSINARLHMVTTKGYKDVSLFNDPQLEACILIVNQDQAFEVIFQMKNKC
jgi:hypothetical protein